MSSLLSLINRPLVVAISIPVITGIASGLTTKTSVNGWYKTIRRPSWTPPNWMFAPVWTFLYASMGYASYLVWKTGQLHPSLNISFPLRLYATQLTLNLAWTPLFFGIHNLGAATVDVAALWGTLVATGWEFYKIEPLAGYLFAPYAAWVSYASALTAWIWWNNGGKDVAGKKE
ncbi:hypothetical protein HK104_002386 [Borealophlyctis nickersoniae]|nr:hypothetical protein HK104_002386 [Borealophlyctis nickersoniae]